MEPISSFRDEHRFLSNFYPAAVEYRGFKYSTAEHAYQTAKAATSVGKEFVRASSTPGEAKRRGRRVHMLADWEKTKLDIMREIVSAKFMQHPNLSRLLLGTGERELIEGNDWGDHFWGAEWDDGCERWVGENHLGEILMSVREELKKKGVPW